MGPRPLTNEEKVCILTLRKENVKIREICRRTQRAKSTVMALLSAARQLPPTLYPNIKSARDQRERRHRKQIAY